MTFFFDKFKEVFASVLPIVILISLLNIFFINIENSVFFRFLISSFIILIGLTFFLFGISIGIEKIGLNLGRLITKPNNIFILLCAGIVLGFLISIAEPDLQILAGQVKTATLRNISAMRLIVAVSFGVAVFVALGLARIVFNISQKIIFLISYSLIGIFSIFSTSEFISISFDASGTTTGAITVPFILALSIGVSRMKKNQIQSESDSFGLIGMASVGAILAVLFLSITTNIKKISPDNFCFDLDISHKVFKPFFELLIPTFLECLISLLPLTIIFLFSNFIWIKLRKKDLLVIIKGLFITLIGLFLFMLGAKAGFLDVGIIMGKGLATGFPRWGILLIGALIGLVSILAEPAVYVLTVQIETVTGGHIPRKIVLIFLCIAVSLAVMFSMLRIMFPPFQLWHILLPGYLVCLGLTFFVPDVFVGIAFDAGGVASGPMTATFVLSLAQGFADAIPSANVLIDGFGIVATVALAPIISLQILGVIYKIKQGRRI